MPDLKTLLILIPACPLAAVLLTALLGPKFLRGKSHWPTVLAFLVSFLASAALLLQLHREAIPENGAAETTVSTSKGIEHVFTLWAWAEIPSKTALDYSAEGITRAVAPFSVEIVLRADPLTSVMLVVVTFVSLLVSIYSIGYMHGDPGYWRFFTYIALFVFSMTMLVSVSNFVLLYVFWELVGLCSYLLIGFWYEKPEAAAAGKKAFLVNRIGDFGFALGVFFLWITYGTLNFHDVTSGGGVLVPGVLGQARMALQDPYVGGALGTASCLLLMLGACGKSAQFPLHVWLPDAMEGPTPVSALIHAATMVTAGVYMIARCMPLFVANPIALYTVSILGAITALLGAIIAVTQTDFKRILAYSTISHLGYMFIALGTGTLLGVTAGMFHLVTHAFFKALMFLGAGSVMHAMGGVIDIRRFSGLRKIMPITFMTILIGSLAMAGVVPFAGFYSKDAVLLALKSRFASPAVEPIYETVYWATFSGILLVCVYTFRPFIMAFFGEKKIPAEAGHHAHESPWTMTMPLILLSIGAFGVGYALEKTEALAKFLAQTPSLAYLGHIEHSSALEEMHHEIGLHSTIYVAFGIALTALLYLGAKRQMLSALTSVMKTIGLYSLSYGKFFFDPLYCVFIVRPLEYFAAVCAWCDHYIVDKFVDLLGSLPRSLGASLRPMQGGLVQFYALAMAIGLLILMGALLL